MLTEYTGDLFTAHADALGHGVNCKGLMGKGIAKAFREQWPDMYSEYRLMCQEELLKPGLIYPWADKVGPTVINIATQEYPGPDASYEWVDAGVRNALAYMNQRGLKSLAIPRIGCGIGGLEWPLVKDLIEVALQSWPELEVQVYSL